MFVLLLCPIFVLFQICTKINLLLFFFFQRDVYFQGSQFRTSPVCIHAAENKSCVQVVLFCVPYLDNRDGALSAGTERDTEIQREGYE